MEDLIGAVPSTSRDRENVLCGKEEENFIKENLLYMEKFITNVRNVEQRLPV